MPSDTARLADAEETTLSGIADWILDEGRCLRLGELIAGFGGRLGRAGIPVSRISLHIRQLHPQFYSRGFFWRRGEAVATESPREHGIERTSAYLDSPLYRVYEHGETVRRRLEDPAAPLDFPILEEVRAEGATDYIVLGMPFRAGSGQAITLATDRPGGFSDADIALVKGALPAFAATAELINLERMAEALLTTYVGGSTGRRVLAGDIRRGDVRRIRAVLWFSDLRNFTSLSETLPGEAVIDLLNDYFEAAAEPITAAGGEILKFIGDAMLAILPVAGDGEEDLRRACENALAAADTAVSAFEAVNALRAGAGKQTFRAGLALHVGEVLYGNIGTESRLDFTVIGPAVNLVSRIEQLCADQGRSVVLSSDFALRLSRPLTSLGRHKLRGIAETQEIFAPE